jgi:hypothetical protein
MKDLNVRSETVKLLQEKIRNTMNHSNFMNRTPIAQQLRKKIGK